jgi:transcriptional regulator, lysR family
MSFYKDAKDIVATLQMAVNRAQRQNIISDTVRIGVSNYVVLFYLTYLLERFHNNYPNIRPNIQVFSYKIILTLFLENKLDILFYYKENMTPKAGTNFLELEKDRFVCLLPVAHPLSLKKSVSITDLKNEQIIMCNPLNAPLSMASFQQKLIEIHSTDNVSYCDSIEIAHSMVAAGMGIAILPSLLTMNSPKFTIVPIDDKIELSFGVFYNKRNMNTALKDFLEIIKKRK